MQVSLETTSTLERRLTITVPAETVDKKVEKRLREMGKRAQMHGFRPGKVPFGMLKKRYGPGARDEVLGEVIRSSYAEAVSDNDLHPAGYPQIDAVKTEEGVDIEFVATLEVYPDIELADLSCVAIERPVASVEQGDIDRVINTIREQDRTFEDKTEGAAESGDRVVIDYSGSIEGEPFEQGSAEDAPLLLGSGQMIPGFEDGIVGMSCGESRDVPVTFPSDYAKSELQGQQALFAITLKSMEKPVLPELDESFLARFGVHDGNLETFREEVAQSMSRELKRAVQAKVRTQVMDSLLETHSFEVPSSAVMQECRHLSQQARERMQQQSGQQAELPELPANLFEQEARKRVRLSVIIGKIVDEHNLQVKDADLHAHMQEMVADFQDPERMMAWYKTNPDGKLDQIRHVVLETLVVDTVVAAAQVTEQACSYEEAVAPAPAKTEKKTDQEDAPVDEASSAS